MGVHLVHRDLEPLGVDGRRPRTWVIRGEHTRAERTVRLHTLAPGVGRELICRVGSGVPILERGGRRWGVPPTPGWAQPGSGQSGHEQRLTQASSPRCARRSFVEEHQARRIFAGLGDTSSNEVIRATGTPDGAGGDPFDKTTVTIIDTDVIPPTLVRMGLDKCSDTFTLIHRAAFIEDPQAREEHFGPPQGTVLRLTPATVTSIADLQPYPVPDLKVRGADHVIDYTREDFTQGEQRHDFILDNVSKQSLSCLQRALTPEGTLVPNGGQFDDRWMASVGNAFRASVSSLFVRQNPRPFLSPPNHEDLVALKELMETGKVAPGGVDDRPLQRTAVAPRGQILLPGELAERDRAQQDGGRAIEPEAAADHLVHDAVVLDRRDPADAAEDAAAGPGVAEGAPQAPRTAAAKAASGRQRRSTERRGRSRSRARGEHLSSSVMGGLLPVSQSHRLRLYRPRQVGCEMRTPPSRRDREGQRPLAANKPARASAEERPP